MPDRALPASRRAPPAPLALPKPGDVAIPLSNDEIQGKALAESLGLTPDVVQAAQQHPGLARLSQPPAAPAPAALPSTSGGGTIKPSSPEAVPKVIKQLVNQVQANPSGNAYTAVQYADQVHPAVAEALKQAGIDVSGYTHVIDSSAVRHVMNHHGDPKMETPRGQIAITAQDFGQLPDVVTNPDQVQYLGKNKTGRDVIRYTKDIGGNLVVVEEVRTGRNQLALNSMWKVARHDQMPSVKTQSSDLTSRTLGGTLPHAGVDSTTAPTGEHITLSGNKATSQKALIEQILASSKRTP